MKEPYLISINLSLSLKQLFTQKLTVDGKYLSKYESFVNLFIVYF